MNTAKQKKNHSNVEKMVAGAQNLIKYQNI